MEELVRDGNAFAIPDFWQQSSFTIIEAQDASSKIDSHSAFSE